MRVNKVVAVITGILLLIGSAAGCESSVSRSTGSTNADDNTVSEAPGQVDRLYDNAQGRQGTWGIGGDVSMIQDSVMVISIGVKYFDDDQYCDNAFMYAVKEISGKSSCDAAREYASDITTEDTDFGDTLDYSSWKVFDSFQQVNTRRYGSLDVAIHTNRNSEDTNGRDIGLYVLQVRNSF